MFAVIKSMSITKVYKQPLFSWLILLALPVYILTVLNNIGYFYADEHYQIIEFALHILGKVPDQLLAWEYKYGLRNGVLPLIASGLIYLCEVAGIDNPFSQALLLRAIGAIVFVTTTIYVAVKNYSPANKTQTIGIMGLTWLLWFMPMLARFSSENFAACLLVILVTLLENKKTRWYILTVTAVLICIRYQTIIVVLTIWLHSWLIVRKNVWPLIAGVFAALIVDVIAGYFLYHKAICPFFNYALMTIGGTGPNFGEQPFYFYITNVCKLAGYPLGITIWIACAYYIITKPKDLISWITVVFLLVHTVMPHKEIRFLFPLILLLPYMFRHLFYKAYFYLTKKVFAFLIFTIAIFNLALLICNCFLPACSPVALINMINKQTMPQHLLYLPYCNPYNPFESLPMQFYANSGVQKIKINQMADMALQTKSNCLLSITQTQYENNAGFLKAMGFKRYDSAYPVMLVKYNCGIWLHGDNNLMLLKKSDYNK